MEEAVSRDVVCLALHIDRQAESGKRGRGSSKCPHRSSVKVRSSRCRSA